MSSSLNIRNFGIIAHIDAGKTTTTERILYLTGMNYRIGEVDDGTTTTDWMQEEKEHGITITSAAVSCNWNDKTFHIIDTPGHVDFTAEVHRSLRILDGVVVVFCGVAGVQTQTETVWKQANKFDIPRIIFVNKLDRNGADFDNVIQEVITKFNAPCVPITAPFYENDKLAGIIDIIKMKKVTFQKDGNIESEEDIPGNLQEIADNYRENLINELTAIDDELLHHALEESITNEMIMTSLRAAVVTRKLVPAMAGSSLKNTGVPHLLDGIAALLPSPDDIGSIEGYSVKKDEWEKIEFNKEGLPIVYIFKVQYHREKGLLAFARLYSGSIKPGESLFNPRTKKKERIQEILKIYADKFDRQESCVAGDIIVMSGMKNIATGDTLCRENHQVILETLEFPEPVISVRVEPKNAIDKEKLYTARDQIFAEDPTIKYVEDPQTGQTLICGMGELHIQILLERLTTTYGIELRSAPPQVAYRETPVAEATENYEFDRKIEGNVQHVKLTLTIAPRDRTGHLTITNNLKEKDKKIIEKLEEGIKASMQSGPEGAYPVIDCEVIIEKLEYERDKTPLAAFEAAANLCIFSLLKKAGTILLEPIMKLEIDVPQEFTGVVIGDLQSRNGIVLDIVKKVEEDIIHAKAPLKSMFGYTTALRSQTQGKGSFSMEFLQYDEG